MMGPTGLSKASFLEIPSLTALKAMGPTGFEPATLGYLNLKPSSLKLIQAPLSLSVES